MLFSFRSLQNFLDLPRKIISFNHVFISMNNFKETFWHFLSHNTGFWLVKLNVTLACDKFALPKLTSSTFQSFPYVNSEKWIRKFCKRPKNRIISGVTRHFSSRSTIQTIVCYACSWKSHIYILPFQYQKRIQLENLHFSRKKLIILMSIIMHVFQIC